MNHGWQFGSNLDMPVSTCNLHYFLFALGPYTVLQVQAKVPLEASEQIPSSEVGFALTYLHVCKRFVGYPSQSKVWPKFCLDADQVAAYPLVKLTMFGVSNCF